MCRLSGRTTSRRTRCTSSRRLVGGHDKGGRPVTGRPPFRLRRHARAAGRIHSLAGPGPGSDPQLPQLLKPDRAGNLLSRGDLVEPDLVLARPIVPLAEECVARCNERCRAQQIDSELANRTLLWSGVLSFAVRAGGSRFLARHLPAGAHYNKQLPCRIACGGVGGGLEGVFGVKTNVFGVHVRFSDPDGPVANRPRCTFFLTPTRNLDT